MAAQDDAAQGFERADAPRDILTAAVLLGLAHLAFVAVRPSPSTGELAAFELPVLVGLAAVTLVAGHSRERRLSALLAVTVLFVTLVGGTWLAVSRLALHWAALALVALVALSGYGLHRYQLLTLDVLGETDEQ